MADIDIIVEKLRTKFPGIASEAHTLLMRGSEPGDQMYIRVAPENLLEVLRFLRDDAATKFEQLCDLTCVDYLNFPDATDRYGVIY
ncbi:MAG: NADH-quinone oxidoreductase subunit C, partial [Phycisphaerae bacterium]